MKDLRFTLITLVALVLAAGPLPTHAATHAAKVIYAFGQVQATSAAGKARTLRKGDRVFPGETVATRRGRTQIKFTDGGFVSLQPNTEYRIDEYNYAGKPDGQERSFLSLIKGSVRLITGVIGRANRQSFRIKTRVATIGIRGTSGKVSHCDSNCGDLPVGTRLQGYGGVWDLVSGSFSGPVASGDAYICDGSTCRQLEGGVAQREDVGTYAFDDEDDDVDYQQGDLVDRDGILCDLGGNCGDTVVLLNQIAAAAFQGSPGDTDAVDGIAVVLTNGAPIAFIGNDDDSDIELFTIDFDALRAALNTFPDPEIVTIGNALLDRVDAATRDNLRSMPASIAPEDFGLTTDNILTFGRWTDGYVLEIEADFDAAGVLSDVFIDLFKLTGFQSEHFIYGPEPGPLPTAGNAVFNFTGGTFSTATDGSSIGLGVTAGQLLWDFGLGSGALAMTVEHGAMIFDVTGSLKVETGEPRFFREKFVFAVFGGSSYPVTLDGFFAGPNNSPPLAAGLGYAIDMFSSFGYDIIGVAGFGLSSFDSAGTPSATVAATGMYIATAHAFDDGFDTNSNGWDFVVDGAGNVATLIGDSVTSFSNTTHPTLCPPCTFDSASATQAESGTMASIGVSWVRWSTGHSFGHVGLVSELDGGDGHIIKVDAPLSALPNDVMGTYTLGNRGGTGATTPTWNHGPAQTFEVAIDSTNRITVDFVFGGMLASHTINFPSGSVTMTGTNPGFPTAGINSISWDATPGNVTGAVGTCVACVFGHDHFTFVGTGTAPDYVVGSGQFNSSGLGSFEVAGAFTFNLPGVLVPYPP